MCCSAHGSFFFRQANPEKRLDAHGNGPYTRAEFEAYYGGTDEWDAAGPGGDPLALPDGGAVDEGGREDDAGGCGLERKCGCSFGVMQTLCWPSSLSRRMSASMAAMGRSCRSCWLL